MKVTAECEDLIKDYILAERRVKRLTEDLQIAKNELSVSEIKLGKFLSPDDASIGESFCVWYGDSLIKSIKISDNESCIKIRTRGKSLLQI